MNELQLRNLTIKSNDGLFSLNDLHKASGGADKDRPGLFLDSKKTQELIDEILNAGNAAIKKSAGRYGGTYACKEIVYAYAMWISPKFNLEVIQFFDDHQKVSNSLGDMVASVEKASSKVIKDLDKATLAIGELNNHGRNWGSYGASIRKAKREAIKQLEKAKDEIQYKLDLL